MLTNIHTRIRQRMRLKESWIIFFIMGIIMMNFPFLQIFNKPLLIGGFPLLFLYYTVGWAVSIGIIYLFTIALHTPEPPPTEKKKQ